MYMLYYKLIFCRCCCISFWASLAGQTYFPAQGLIAFSISARAWKKTVWHTFHTKVVLSSHASVTGVNKFFARLPPNMVNNWRHLSNNLLFKGLMSVVLLAFVSSEGLLTKVWLVMNDKTDVPTIFYAPSIFFSCYLKKLLITQTTTLSFNLVNEFNALAA